MSEIVHEGDKVLIKKNGQNFEVRKLNKREKEIYTHAIQMALSELPSFSDAVALMRPYYDGSAPTLYTDRYARMGIGDAFFNKWTTQQRKATVIHETMHILNSHFEREENMGLNNPNLGNVAGDFEINCAIDTVEGFDISVGILPDKAPFNFPRNKTLEFYVDLLLNDPNFKRPDSNCPVHGKPKDDESDQNNSGNENNDGQTDSSGNNDEQSGNSQGNSAGEDGSRDSQGESNAQGSSNSEQSADDSMNGSNSDQGDNSGANGADSKNDHGEGQGDCTCGTESSPCDRADDTSEAAADAAGIERASDAEKNDTKAKTAARIVEDLKKDKSRGSGHGNSLLQLALSQLRPARVNWQNQFRRVFRQASDAVVRGRTDYSYRRMNRRMNNSQFIFPGIVSYLPTVMFGVDTSGSMDKTDFLSVLSEVESILKDLKKGKDSFTMFSVDTDISNVKPVSNVKDIEFYGGGGTDMSVGLRYVNELPQKKKPNLFILATDGGTNWTSYIHEVERIKGFFHILLVTSPWGWNTVPENLKKMKNIKVFYTGDETQTSGH